MTMWMILGVCVVVVGFVATGSTRGHSIKRGMRAARATGDLAPLTEALKAQPDESGTHWDQAIGALWQAYAREAAAGLVVVAAQHSQAKIVQYWIKQVIEIEPEIAKEVFTPQFLMAHFDPSVASQCGRCGCKG